MEMVKAKPKFENTKPKFGSKAEVRKYKNTYKVGGRLHVRLGVLGVGLRGGCSQPEREHGLDHPGHHVVKPRHGHRPVDDGLHTKQPNK